MLPDESVERFKRQRHPHERGRPEGEVFGGGGCGAECMDGVGLRTPTGRDNGEGLHRRVVGGEEPAGGAAGIEKEAQLGAAPTAADGGASIAAGNKAAPPLAGGGAENTAGTLEKRLRHADVTIRGLTVSR